jgi:hypothetical protein
MAVRLEPYANQWIPAVRAFNARIASVAPYALGTGEKDPNALERARERPLWLEELLVVEDEHVRGGVMLQHQDFVVAGERRHVVNIQLPISEGLIERKYAYLGMWILQSVVKRHPLAFAVGMGGVDQPLPKLLTALGWDVALTPFYYSVHRVGRFLREMPMLRRSPARRAAATVAAATGAGWIGVRALLRWTARQAPRAARLNATRVTTWDSWADDVWERLSGAGSAVSSMIGVRSTDVLALLYPPSGDRYHCFRLQDRGQDVGWVALIVTPMRDSDKFGNLAVGTLLDGVVLPGYELAAVRAARRQFDELGAGLSLANHTHVTWQRAFRDAGYLSGPSNYVLARSKALTQAVRQAADGDARMHITRGDGDGRLHL